MFKPEKPPEKPEVEGVSVTEGTATAPEAEASEEKATVGSEQETSEKQRSEEATGAVGAKDPLIAVKGADGRIITSEDVQNGLKAAGTQIVDALAEPFQDAVTEVVGTVRRSTNAFISGFTNRNKPEPDLRDTKEEDE